MAKLSGPLTRELVYREAFEWNAALGWIVATIVMVGGLPSSWELMSRDARQIYAGLITFTLLAALKNLFQAWPIIRSQMKLFMTGMLFVTAAEVRLFNNVGKKRGIELANSSDDAETILGYGYEWGPEHSNHAYKLMNMDTNRSQIVMPLPVRWYVQMNLEETRKMGGQAWIYNLGEEKLQKVRADNAYGHTLITGNVGTGKTTLLRLLSASAIHLGHVVMAIDPKNDEDWRDAMKHECEELGIPFYSFHPSKASSSVAIDPLRNYTRITEIASRISGVVSDTSKADPFRDFGWYAIYRTALCCAYLGEKPTLMRIYKYLTAKRTLMFTKVLEHFFDTRWEDGWRKTHEKKIKDAGDDWLSGMIAIYDAEHLENDHEKPVDEAIAAYRHPFEHYQKMTTSLLPLFANLTAEPLDELLSPEYDANSTREIIDLRSMFDTGGVLHVAIDSLSDPQTAQKLVQLLVADAAAIAGSRYNQGLEGTRRISLFFDEAHAALCEQLLSLLAQGRASKMGMTIVTQTIPDLVAKSSEAVADRVIGLCNNWITTRVSDPVTQQKMAANFGSINIETRELTLSQRTDTVDSISKFAGGFSEKLGQADKEGFPPNLLGELPKLQCVARLADGRKLVLKIPVIKRAV